jgi:polyisoprenoid-binding protein YceI
MTERRIDQQSGDLTLHTGRAGAASKVGHDLTIRVASWSAVAEVEGASVARVRLVALLSSLEVVRGEGGVKPLSDKDKATVLKSAAETLHAKEHPEVVFECGPVPTSPGESTVAGTVTVAGTTQPIDLTVVIQEVGGALRFQVRGEVVQTAFGIKPYSGLLGALKVRDMVEVRADLRVATS